VKKQVFVPALCFSALLAVPSLPAMAQANDVPPGHWALEAVRDLASEGLVLGYPDGNFLGQRALTRYEMATLIKRVLDRLEGRIDAAQPGEATPISPASPVPTSLTTEQMAQVRRLVEEYKTELAVIGADLLAIKDRLDNHELRLQSIDEALNDPEGPVQATAAAVANLRKTSIDGYIQFRYQNRSDDRGDVQPGGVLSNEETFFLRRNRIRVRHTFKEHNMFAFQIDAAQGNTVTIKDAYLTLPLLKAKGLDTPPVLWAGQFNIPFGFEIQQSSSEREFPERSRGERALFAGERDRGIKIEGTLGNQALTYQLGVLNGNGIGDASGNGTIPGTGTRGAGGVQIPTRTHNWRDTNEAKDFVGHLVYEPPHGAFAIGASGYFGETTAATGAFDEGGRELYDRYDKLRYGAEFRFYGLPETIFRGEYVLGQEFNAGRRNEGGLVEDSADFAYWYAQIIRNLNDRNAIGVRYDYYDPDTDDPLAPQVSSVNSHVGVHTLTAIAQRFLTDSTRLTLAYEKPYLPRNSSGVRSKQDLFTVQFQYRY